MNIYIAFLLLLFVIGGVYPRLAQNRWVLLGICVALCLSFYSARFFG